MNYQELTIGNDSDDCDGDGEEKKGHNESGSVDYCDIVEDAFASSIYVFIIFQYLKRKENKIKHNKYCDRAF